MKCFFPCFAATHKLLATCSCYRDDQFCTCRHVVATSVKTKLPESTSSKVAPMSKVQDSFKFPLSAIPSPARRHNVEDEPRTPTMVIGKLRLEEPHKGQSPSPKQILKTDNWKIEATRTPDRSPKSGSGRTAYGVAEERGSHLFGRKSPSKDVVGNGSTDAEKAGLLVPVVSIIETASRKPVVDHEQLFAIMKKKPGWMIKPHKHSGERWVIFQHWNKNHCDAKARLPYPSLRVASPEILDSFVQIVNQQHEERVFDVLSFCAKHGGSWQATAPSEVKDKFCISPVPVLAHSPRAAGVRQNPKSSRCSEQSSVRSLHFR